MTFNKTNTGLGIAVATLTMASALVSPQAFAKKVKHHRTAAVSAPSAASIAAAANKKAEILEAQLQAMQDEIVSLRAQVNAPRAESAKVQELDQWMASQKEQEVKPKSKDNMVFFRGGYGHNNAQRGGTVDPTTVSALGLANRNGTLVGPISDRDAWYFGAGFDFSLDDNLFGLMNNTEVFAELMFDYKQLGQRKNNGLSTAAVTTLAAATGGLYNLPAANTQTATVNQLSLAASPKIKFMKGSSFRPWLIPVGFELSIISPPSDAITVLTPGMQFGAGADYKIWKNLYIGADARYHYAPSSVDGVRVNGVTAGGYVGIGF